MNPAIFDAVQPLLDKIAEIADKQFLTPEFQNLLSELAAVVGKNKIASISLTVDIFDEERAGSLPLLTTGLSAVIGKKPFGTWGDSSPQRYVVDEGIQVVPHDRCPKCWASWDFKLRNRTCSNCGITLGKQCKLLLDTDECPNCSEGKVTMAKPRCNECGFEADQSTVVWG